VDCNDIVRDHLEKITAKQIKSVKSMDDLMIVTGDCQFGLLMCIASFATDGL